MNINNHRYSREHTRLSLDSINKIHIFTQTDRQRKEAERYASKFKWYVFTTSIPVWLCLALNQISKNLAYFISLQHSERSNRPTGSSSHRVKTILPKVML
jgi:hypothetical protein